MTVRNYGTRANSIGAWGAAGDVAVELTVDGAKKVVEFFTKKDQPDDDDLNWVLIGIVALGIYTFYKSKKG